MNDEFTKLLDAIIRLRDQYAEDNIPHSEVYIYVLGDVFTHALQGKTIPRCFQIVYPQPIDVNLLIEPVTKLYENLSIQLSVIAREENKLVNGAPMSYAVFKAEPK